MKFLVDNALSPWIAEQLRAGGYDAVHVRDYGIHQEDDSVVLDRSDAEGRILLSADTDFGTLLAERMSQSPSVVLFRGSLTQVPADQLKALLANISQIRDSLLKGAIVVIEAGRVRVRDLPLL